MESLTALLNVQAGLVTLKQLANLGFTRSQIRANLNAGRWVKHGHQVVATATGELTREQRCWLAVLHAGPSALIAGLSALEVHGLKGWSRDNVTVLVGPERRPRPLPGVTFHRHRSVSTMAANRRLPLQRIEPAALWFASTEPRLRTAHGLLAAVVQQRLSTPERLTDWTERMAPMKGADEIRRVLTEFAGGAQSMAEVDVGKFCKEFGFVLPTRQRCRTDETGRVRFTDAEWLLEDGRTLVLEVDGALHLSMGNYSEDIRRQRALTREDVIIWRCTAYELRNEPDELADLMRRLGVPRTQ